tara:strand:- start:390 stop:725 length:336 start_codon:yes stop_codon:yes gene_type:complete
MSAPSAFRSVICKARKAHKCCECHVVINIGDQYQYSSGVWDGEPDDYKQSLGCGEIFDAVTRDGGEVCFTHLRDFLFDSDCNHADERAVFAKIIGVDADAIARLMDLEVSS